MLPDDFPPAAIDDPASAALPEALAADVAAVQQIDAIPTILETVCRATGMGFAAVARVTSDRWVACGVRDGIAFGLEPGGELAVDTTICREIRDGGAMVVIDDVATDADYGDHATPALYGFKSYISVPVRLRSGDFFGTLCAIDPNPAKLSDPHTIGMFTLFADLIAFHLDAQQQLARSAATLLDERATAELRDQFIAVLSHDLRNPLASVNSGVALLTQGVEPAKSARILGLMQESVDRMSALIENVLDLARGRLGGGLAIRRKPVDLATLLTQLRDELQASHPDRAIETDIELPADIACDRVRIAQLFSNLLGNAIAHGDPAVPIRLAGHVADDALILSVANGGPPIPRETIDRLFQPYSRGLDMADERGLGLGLYIASEIAASHGGTLAVTSTPEVTRFTFTMPLA